MKKNALILSLAIVTLLTACKDEETTSSITNDQAAEMVSMSLAENSMGATAIVQTSVQTGSSTTRSAAPQKVQSVSPDLTFAKDTTFTLTSKPGAIISYSFTATYGYNFTLNLQGQFTSASENYTYSGNYDAPRVSSTHTGNGTLALTNMNTSVVTVNGTFARTANHTFKGTEALTTNTVVNLNLADILVNKSTATIQSGSATLTITGSVPNKGDFSYTGTITFNGNSMATLVIQGQSYTVNIKTGEYTAI